jgi:hypothetical protein
MSCQKSQPPLCLFLVLRTEENESMMDNPADQKQMFRAYLSVAVFCEKVLRETDNVLSVIRVIDRFNVLGATPEMQPAVLQFTILILFKSGFLRGKQLISLRPKGPDGEGLPQLAFPVLFEGDDDRGNALIAGAQFVAQKEGLYWFDVYLNEEAVTRMPLRVAYQQQPQAIK